jgi:hypothetical protein
MQMSLCFRGYNPSYFSVVYSGFPGGTYHFRVVDTGGPYGSTRSGSGPSGRADLGSFIYYTPPGDDNDGAIVVWPQWSTSASGPWTSGTTVYVRDIPAC